MVVANAGLLTDTWTTVHWIAAALAHRTVAVFGVDDVTFDGTWRTRVHVLESPMEPAAVARALRERTARRISLPLAALSRVWWRRNPYDRDAIGLVRSLAAVGVPVDNHPRALEVLTSKIWLVLQQDVPQPETLVTARCGEAERWAHGRPAVVVKPSRGSGGHGVSRATDRTSLRQAFHAARARSRWVLVQEAVHAREERRLLVCDGELLGGYLRIAHDDFRHNLSRGAHVGELTVDDHDRAVVALLAPRLRALGARFVAVDTLAGRVVEINAVNPGGTVRADALSGSRLAQDVVERLLEAPSPPAVALGPTE